MSHRWLWFLRIIFVRAPVILSQLTVLLAVFSILLIFISIFFWQLWKLAVFLTWCAFIVGLVAVPLRAVKEYFQAQHN